MSVHWNHTMEGAYPPEQLAAIPGVWRYGARALCCTAPEDSIQLHADLKGQYPWISEHYRRLEIPHSENIIWDASIKRVRDFPDRAWEVFLFSELHHEARPDDGWLYAARQMNEKNEFIRLAQRGGWGIPKTFCFDCPHLALAELDSLGLTYPVFRKTSCSAAGEGVMRTDTLDELLADLQSVPKGLPLQLQLSVSPTATFVNVQYEVIEGEARRLGLTDQVLDGFAHAGNSCPSAFGDEVWQLCDPAAQAIADLGMKSVFAFDVAVGEGQPPVLIECNPRWNACTYYFRLAALLGTPCWRCRNLSVAAETLPAIELEGIEFDRNTMRGIVVVSWGTILDGKLGILTAGSSSEEIEQLERRFLELNCRTVVH